MKKIVYVLLMAGLMLATVFGVFSVNAADNSQQQSSSTAQSLPISGSPYIECFVFDWNGIPDCAPIGIPLAKLELTGSDGTYKIKWTNLRGRRTFSGLSLGVTYTITASADGYTTESKSTEIPADPGYASVQIELEPTNTPSSTTFVSPSSSTATIVSTTTTTSTASQSAPLNIPFLGGLSNNN